MANVRVAGDARRASTRLASCIIRAVHTCSRIRTHYPYSRVCASSLRRCASRGRAFAKTISLACNGKGASGRVASRRNEYSFFILGRTRPSTLILARYQYVTTRFNRDSLHRNSPHSEKRVSCIVYRVSVHSVAYKDSRGEDDRKTKL